jgi:hypothetical protein
MFDRTDISDEFSQAHFIAIDNLITVEITICPPRGLGVFPTPQQKRY